MTDGFLRSSTLIEARLRSNAKIQAPPRARLAPAARRRADRGRGCARGAVLYSLGPAPGRRAARALRWEVGNSAFRRTKIPSVPRRVSRQRRAGARIGGAIARVGRWYNRSGRSGKGRASGCRQPAHMHAATGVFVRASRRSRSAQAALNKPLGRRKLGYIHTAPLPDAGIISRVHEAACTGSSTAGGALVFLVHNSDINPSSSYLSGAAAALGTSARSGSTHQMPHQFLRPVTDPGNACWYL